MKYFFLSEGWTYGRVWEKEGLWDEIVWRRKPEINKLKLGIVENEEVLWLYQVEDAILMLEVKPDPQNERKSSSIGQVVLKRLINSEQVIKHLVSAQAVVH
jgi:hypothetical protein